MKKSVYITHLDLVHLNYIQHPSCITPVILAKPSSTAEGDLSSSWQLLTQLSLGKTLHSSHILGRFIILCNWLFTWPRSERQQGGGKTSKTKAKPNIPKSQTSRKREEQSVRVIREEMKNKPACTGCSYPWIPSPLSLWLEMQPEVWHRLCVNMLCQLRELWANRQPSRHTLLLSLCPVFTLNLYQLLCLGPSQGSHEFDTRVTDRGENLNARTYRHLVYVNLTPFSTSGAPIWSKDGLTSSPAHHEAECKQKHMP